MPQNEDQHFIREKIKDKPINKKKFLQRGIAVTGYAILFGFVSCLVFCALKPAMELWFEADPDPQIEIPKDTLTDETAADDGPNTQADDTHASKTENSEKKTVYITEKKAMTLEDFQVLQNQLYIIGNRVNRSIVTVTGVRESTDIFDSPYEAEGYASGLIIGNNGRELLVLTEYEVIKNVKSIWVTFINNDMQKAELKKYDGNTGIAVLSVPVSEITEVSMKGIEIAKLGNSLRMRQGRLVIALGSPLGTNYSILVGNITSASNLITTEDWNYTVFTTDIVANANGNGVLVNTDGEVIGLYLKSEHLQREQNTLTAVSISEMKDIIERLSNGKNIPYIGIKGSTVTDTLSQEYKIPKGVYIREVVKNSPAMAAGLQSGDVIAAVDEQKILTMEDYQNKLLTLRRGDEVRIEVNRQGNNGYKKHTCTVEVGVLK